MRSTLLRATSFALVAVVLIAGCGQAAEDLRRTAVAEGSAQGQTAMAEAAAQGQTAAAEEAYQLATEIAGQVEQLPRPPVPQPVPMPEPGDPASLAPIVFVPGYWACSTGRANVLKNLKWHGTDKQAYPELYNTQLWPEAVEIYKDLLGHLIDQGYTLNQDLFVACYDWFGTLEHAANDLPHEIDAAYFFTRKPVTIITHSTGALVTRYAIAKNKINRPIQDIIMIAPPNQGVAKSYYAWEGGFLNVEEGGPGMLTRLSAILHCGNLTVAVGVGKDAVEIQKKAHECLQQQDVVSPVPFFTGATDEEIPIVAWFIPAWQFLQKEDPYGYDDVPIKRLNTKEHAKHLFDTIQGEVFVLSGSIENSTIERIHVAERADTDAPLWYYGKPLCLNTETICAQNRTFITRGSGDGTILLSSAHISHADEADIAHGRYHQGGDLTFTGSTTREAGHAEGMVKDTRILTRISKLLDVAPPRSRDNYQTTGHMLAGILSPASLLVTDASGRRAGVDTAGNLLDEIPGAIYGQTDDPLGPKFIFLPDPQEGEYRFEVNGIAEGEYDLVALASDSNQPLLLESGRITPGETRTYRQTYTSAADDFVPTRSGAAPVPLWTWVALAAMVAGFGGLIAAILIRQRTTAPAPPRPGGQRPAAAGAPPLAALVLERGRANRGELPLAAGRTYLIGRHPTCDLVLDDPRASGRHVSISPGAQGFTLADLGSTNGTLHNGRPCGETRLCDGDRIAIGDTLLQFRVLR